MQAARDGSFLFIDCGWGWQRWQITKNGLVFVKDFSDAKFRLATANPARATYYEVHHEGTLCGYEIDGSFYPVEGQAKKKWTTDMGAEFNAEMATIECDRATTLGCGATKIPPQHRISREYVRRGASVFFRLAFLVSVEVEDDQQRWTVKSENMALHVCKNACDAPAKNQKQQGLNITNKAVVCDAGTDYIDIKNAEGWFRYPCTLAAAKPSWILHHYVGNKLPEKPNAIVLKVSENNFADFKLHNIKLFKLTGRNTAILYFCGGVDVPLLAFTCAVWEIEFEGLKRHFRVEIAPDRAIVPQWLTSKADSNHYKCCLETAQRFRQCHKLPYRSLLDPDKAEGLAKKLYIEPYGTQIFQDEQGVIQLKANQRIGIFCREDVDRVARSWVLDGKIYNKISDSSVQVFDLLERCPATKTFVYEIPEEVMQDETTSLAVLSVARAPPKANAYTALQSLARSAMPKLIDEGAILCKFLSSEGDPIATPQLLQINQDLYRRMMSVTLLTHRLANAQVDQQIMRIAKKAFSSTTTSTKLKIYKSCTRQNNPGKLFQPQKFVRDNFSAAKSKLSCISRTDPVILTVDRLGQTTLIKSSQFPVLLDGSLERKAFRIQVGAGTVIKKAILNPGKQDIISILTTPGINYGNGCKQNKGDEYEVQRGFDPNFKFCLWVAEIQPEQQLKKDMKKALQWERVDIEDAVKKRRLVARVTDTEPQNAVRGTYIQLPDITAKAIFDTDLFAVCATPERRDGNFEIVVEQNGVCEIKNISKMPCFFKDQYAIDTAEFDAAQRKLPIRKDIRDGIPIQPNQIVSCSQIFTISGNAVTQQYQVDPAAKGVTYYLAHKKVIDGLNNLFWHRLEKGKPRASNILQEGDILHTHSGKFALRNILKEEESLAVSFADLCL